MHDPLKIFLGQLHGGIIKPVITQRLTASNIPWIDVIVPPSTAAQRGTAFVIVGTPEDGQWTVQALHGKVDPILSPSCVQAATRPTWEPSVCLFKVISF